MRNIIILFLLTVAATRHVSGQDDSRRFSTVTLGVGGAGGGFGGGPAFNANFEYRFFKHFAGEAGVSTFLPRTFYSLYAPIYAIPSGASLSPTGYTFFPVQDRSRVTMLPFGVKGILPFKNGRVELFAGMGAAYARNARFCCGGGWLGQGSVGAAVALDKRRHFWVGTTWRFFGDVTGGSFRSNVTDRNWYTGTADVGFRFGR